MLSPFFAWFFNSAKMRSCLRIRFAPSISLVLAISTSSVTGLDLRSDRCMDGWGAGRNRSSLGVDARPHFLSGRLAPENVPRRRWWRSREAKLLGSAVQSFRRLAVSQVAVNKRRELGFRKCSDLLRGNLTALEQDQRRNAADAVLHRRARIGV